MPAIKPKTAAQAAAAFDLQASLAGGGLNGTLTATGQTAKGNYEVVDKSGNTGYLYLKTLQGGITEGTMTTAGNDITCTQGFRRDAANIFWPKKEFVAEP